MFLGGIPGKIHISQATKDALTSSYVVSNKNYLTRELRNKSILKVLKHWRAERGCQHPLKIKSLLSPFHPQVVSDPIGELLCTPLLCKVYFLEKIA